MFDLNLQRAVESALWSFSKTERMSAAMASVGSSTAVHHDAAHIGLHSQTFDSSKLRQVPGFAASSTALKWRNSARFSEGASGRTSKLWGGDCRQLFLETGDSVSRRRRADSIRAMAVVEKRSGSRGRFYFNVTGFPFPLGPFLQRRTIRKEVRVLQ